MLNERGNSGSVRGPQKPTGVSRHGAECLLYGIHALVHGGITCLSS